MTGSVFTILAFLSLACIVADPDDPGHMAVHFCTCSYPANFTSHTTLAKLLVPFPPLSSHVQLLTFSPLPRSSPLNSDEKVMGASPALYLSWEHCTPIQIVHAAKPTEALDMYFLVTLANPELKPKVFRSPGSGSSQLKLSVS